MAKSKKSVSSDVSFTLAKIVEAGDAGMFTPAVINGPLVEAGHVEINSAVVDSEGNVATRATAAGIAFVAAQTEKPAEVETEKAAEKVEKIAFKIDADVPMPEIPRTGGGRTEMYPFSQLTEVKMSFFVAGKTALGMGSTLVGAQNRFAVDTGEKKVNRAGEEVAVLKRTREFKAFDVVENDVKGVRIFRTL